MADKTKNTILSSGIPLNVVHDLVGRFTSNIPEEEQTDLIRMCFQVELSHWMFVDRYCTKENAELKHLAHIPFQTFAKDMFHYTPNLQHHEPALDYIINNFRDYKQKVPTFGAILLNADMNKVLLVQGFGNSWGFPKGKVNQDEDDLVCAIREVQEETGYDVEDLIRANHFIESLARDRKDRLYIVVGVDMEYHFKPHTAYEIKQIAWFGIEELPDNKKDNVVSSRGISNSNFFTIYPYVRRLKKWIADKVSGANKLQNYTCVGPTQCQFPFPYPMGFRGSRQFHPPPLIPGQFIPQAQAQASPVQPPLRFVDWTPKNDIRNIGFGVPIPPQLNPEMSIHPITSTTRNPKRRLFVEDVERDLINPTEPSTSDDPTDFFSGRGAKAWLNFKLDVSEIMSTFSVC